MLNPHQNLKEWLNTIDKSNLQDIAFLLSGSLYFSQVFEAAHDSEKMLEKFW
ncbi:hypothetical protein [Acinetobacter pittii]|uniref:hypothetical protein n=1 Tax=Acinetobacter pittii TaxID=48296 RepID=UPI0039F585E9